MVAAVEEDMVGMAVHGEEDDMDAEAIAKGLEGEDILQQDEMAGVVMGMVEMAQIILGLVVAEGTIKMVDKEFV